MVHLGLFILVLLQCCTHQAASDVHCITADSTKLGITLCVTLSEFATDVVHYVCSNSTLVFLPGRHYLMLNLTLSNMDNLSITSENSTAQIVCTDYSHITFNSSQHVHINNIEFIGCGGNKVENVQEFVVRHSTFKGEDNSETALELLETSAEIVNSTFVSSSGKIFMWMSQSYRSDKRHGAIIANQSNANISQCIFISNEAEAGGAIFVGMHSIIILQKCLFINNTADIGGVLFSDSSTIIIEESEFDNNTADIGGVLFSNSSNITIQTSEFDNNSAIYGGLMCSLKSNIRIEVSEFDNNTADIGGVLISDSSTITIESSEFNNNTANIGGVLFLDSSNITIEASEFDNNTATWGGVLLFTCSNITIETSEFDNNTAHVGGVLLSESNNISIEKSVFDTNTATLGGVLFSNHSNITIETSEFDNNTADGGGVLLVGSSNIVETVEAIEFDVNNTTTNGGILFATNSNITIVTSEFNNNTATFGGVLSSLRSNFTIKVSEFDDNTADVGGVLYSESSTITIEASEFDNNTADIGGVLFSNSSNITIQTSEFDNNTATYGGVLSSLKSNITIEVSEFDNNTATWGGVVFSKSSNITIETSEFDNNTAFSGGVLLVSTYSNVTIETSKFNKNTGVLGGVLCSTTISTISMGNSVFANNNAPVGAVIYAVDDSTVNQYKFLVIGYNRANKYAVVFLHYANFNVHYSGKMLFSNNFRSLVAFNSNITFNGYIMFENNQPPLHLINNKYVEGGSITLFQSNVYLDGTCNLVYNQADNGGAIFSTESRLFVNGNVTIAHNTATRNGGGVYLLNSVLNCQQNSQFVFFNNTATHKGGGLHAISSSIKVSTVYSRTKLIFDKNMAERGGGLSLDSDAKLYILKYVYGLILYQTHTILLKQYYAHNVILNQTYYDTNTTVFTANTADYGGAVYVDDDTNSGKCADSPKTECFFQVLAIHDISHEFLWTHSIHFSDNKAYISGSTLYGGLLDRCAVSQFAEVQNKHWSEEDYEYAGNGVNYFYDVSTIANSSIADFSISSRPIQVCLCIDNEHNCTYQGHVAVRKGESFTVSLVAVDQTGHPVNSTIQASLNFTESGIAEGQLAQQIAGECTNLTFNVVSSRNTEELTLYASDGPCKNAGISKKIVTIHFLPCGCPVGLQISGKSDNCTCNCHRNIRQYVEDCDSHTGSFVRKPQTRAWISYINHTNVSGYLIFSNCPFDYCNSSSPPVNLNQPNGVDAQCAFNRSSLLCGSCHPDLSLSLGSSRCISCPSYWPAHLLTITIAASLVGIALVAMLLVLNISVAVGTLNGLIFYANVVYANKSILLPFKESNFLLVFMSWLNLELGIDTCYFPGMDTYTKTWLQLAFPAYIIVLVVLVMVISSYSIRFSNIIRKKDPVATLATLILLSYAKLLEICFKSLSVGILEYPDGSHELLWLPDATVKYLSRKHIPLFIVAVLILLAGLVYTVLLFSWQWLLLLPSWRIFKWSRNPKLQTFIQTYHTPYTPKCRYWTGLLLLARIVLYLVAALNVSNHPQVALVAIIFTVSSIKGLMSKIYNKWLLDMLETFFYWNILLFAVFTWYTIDNIDRNREAIAYSSVIITFVVLLLIILYHVYMYTSIFSKVKTTKPGRMIHGLLIESDPIPKPNYRSLSLDEDIHRSSELLEIIDQPVHTNDYNIMVQKPVKQTHTVVEVQLVPKDADTQSTAGTVQLKVDEEN